MKWAFLAAALLAIGLVQFGAMSVWVVVLSIALKVVLLDRTRGRPGCRLEVPLASIQDPDQAQQSDIPPSWQKRFRVADSPEIGPTPSCLAPFERPGIFADSRRSATGV